VTAEVAILNREAVALAADSAVTIEGESGQKIFATANKLFNLSKKKPVGVMLYGSAGLCELPWETMIKLYRDKLGRASFPTLDEYAADFLAYLHSEMGRFFPAKAQEECVTSAVHAFLHSIKARIDERVEDHVQASGPITAADIDGIAKEVIEQAHASIMGGAVVPGLPAGHEAHVRNAYRTQMNSHIDLLLGAYHMAAVTRRRLLQLLTNLFIRLLDEFESPFQTGLVFAGFGENEVFPHLREWTFDGVAADHVKAHEARRLDIEQVGMTAVVVPFAQREMVFRFMEGVDPDYEEVVEDLFRQIIEEMPAVLLSGLPGLSQTQKDAVLKRATQATGPAMDTIHRHLQTVRRDSFADPVANLVDSLPREELASMAEALVNLTSFKRRISWDAETVGGATDVAVISRGDGFIWIKRKHYFSPELNPGFMVNRYGGR
jgi:hypothetical protein